MADLKKILVVGTEYSGGHKEDMTTYINELEPHASEIEVLCKPFNSTEGGALPSPPVLWICLI